MKQQRKQLVKQRGQRQENQKGIRYNGREARDRKSQTKMQEYREEYGKIRSDVKDIIEIEKENKRNNTRKFTKELKNMNKGQGKSNLKQ